MELNPSQKKLLDDAQTYWAGLGLASAEELQAWKERNYCPEKEISRQMNLLKNPEKTLQAFEIIMACARSLCAQGTYQEIGININLGVHKLSQLAVTRPQNDPELLAVKEKLANAFDSLHVFFDIALNPMRKKECAAESKALAGALVHEYREGIIHTFAEGKIDPHSLFGAYERIMDFLPPAFNEMLANEAMLLTSGKPRTQVDAMSIDPKTVAMLQKIMDGPTPNK